MRLTTLRAGVSSPYTNLQNLSYTYDAVGNVASIVDGVNSSQRQCFGFDALDRLTNAFTGNSDCTAYTTGGTGPYNHTYVYDAVGNLTSYAGNAYTYGDSSHKHAVTSAYGNSYGYDGNGNQTSRTIGGVVYTFVFDYENRLTEVKQGTTTLATFLYDADGNRVKGTVNGTATVYIAGIYEYQGGATTKYYEGGGLRRAGYSTNNGVFYMLSDHLKSTSALVARNGVLNVKYFYYPYGARRGVPFNTITARHFTGQYHETALPGGEGLSYYGARWYDPRLGRFLSADTIVPNASNPQDLNRFAYVRNNPLRYVDPSGHMLCEGAVSCSGGGGSSGGVSSGGNSGGSSTTSSSHRSANSNVKRAAVVVSPRYQQPPKNRYWTTKKYGFFDVQHFNTGDIRNAWTEFQRLVNNGLSGSVTFRQPIRRSFPLLGSTQVGVFRGEYSVDGGAIGEDQMEGVFLAMYEDWSSRFEDWEGVAFLLSGKATSFAVEDLPSQYLGAIAVMRNVTPHDLISRYLGGVTTSSDERPQGGGKNDEFFPKVGGLDQMWPSELQVTPIVDSSLWHAIGFNGRTLWFESPGRDVWGELP